jgi:hypothetical protein
MCSDDGLVPGGCPTFSRAGNALISTCDAATDLCQAPGTAPPCEDDVDCEGFAVSDDAADTCNGDECICFESRCLRRCDSDLDCPVSTPMAPAAQRYECDEPAEVCIPEDSCLSHETCKVRLADYRAECSPQGTCTVPCVTDLDCNRGGLTGGLVAVCDDADGLCKPIGCTDHLECVGTANGVRLFCTAPVAPGAGDAVSAITD